MIRVYIGIAVITAVLGGGWFVVSVIQDNALLKQQNSEKDDLIQSMVDEKELTNEVLTERDREVDQLWKNNRELNNELGRVKNDTCLDSFMPSDAEHILRMDSGEMGRVQP